jgi:hypothetical protein
MNDDDVLLPGAVTAMDDGFSIASDVIAAYGLEQIINSAGELLPEPTARDNAEHRRTPQFCGVHRDLLVCAFWQQIPHVGYLVDATAARRIGFRDRSEVGLAIDIDFAIRLARTYRGSAFVCLDRPTSQSRSTPTRLSRTELDVCYKLYDVVSTLDNLSEEEACARDVLLATMAVALRENALVRRRSAALRIFFSGIYSGEENLAKKVYALSLIAMPRLTYALRTLAKRRLASE